MTEQEIEIRKRVVHFFMTQAEQAKNMGETFQGYITNPFVIKCANDFSFSMKDVTHIAHVVFFAARR